MLKELVFSNTLYNQEDFNLILSLASTSQISRVSVPTSLLKYCESINKHKRAALIDYPFGLSNCKTRVTDGLYAVKLGVTCLDIVLNPYFIVNNMYDDLMKETDSFINTIHRASNNSCDVRIIIESALFTLENVAYLFDIIKFINISGIILATGTMPHDHANEVLLSKMAIEKTNLPVYAVNPFLEIQISNFKKVNISGIRFSTPQRFSFLKQFI